MMSTSMRITTRPTNAPKAAAPRGMANDVEAVSPVNVTETVPEAMIPVEEYLIYLTMRQKVEGHLAMIRALLMRQ